MDTSLHDKLAKILRLAERAATEGERQAALARAQALAFKHNLDLSAVNLEESETTKVGQHVVGETDAEWQMNLWNSLAIANFCRVYFMGDKRSARIVVVGRPHNVEVVKSMYAYLQPQMEQEAMREVSRRGQLPRYALITLLGFVKDHPHYLDEVPSVDIPPWGSIKDMLSAEAATAMEKAREDLVTMLRGEDGLRLIMLHTSLTRSYASEIRPYIKRGELAPEIVDDLKSWKWSFQRAMVHRVYERLLKEREKLENDAGDSGHALVVREEAAVNEYYDELGLSDAAASQRSHNMRGYAAGREAADRVSITQRETLGNVSGRELGA